RKLGLRDSFLLSKDNLGSSFSLVEALLLSWVSAGRRSLRSSHEKRDCSWKRLLDSVTFAGTFVLLSIPMTMVPSIDLESSTGLGESLYCPFLLASCTEVLTVRPPVSRLIESFTMSLKPTLVCPGFVFMSVPFKAGELFSDLCTKGSSLVKAVLPKLHPDILILEQFYQPRSACSDRRFRHSTAHRPATVSAVLSCAALLQIERWLAVCHICMELQSWEDYMTISRPVFSSTIANLLPE
ncbi:hypothetical protein EJB05_11425, partial [Eragrostis curvula]